MSCYQDSGDIPPFRKSSFKHLNHIIIYSFICCFQCVWASFCFTETYSSVGLFSSSVFLCDVWLCECLLWSVTLAEWLSSALRATGNNKKYKRMINVWINEDADDKILTVWCVLHAFPVNKLQKSFLSCCFGLLGFCRLKFDVLWGLMFQLCSVRHY